MYVCEDKESMLKTQFSTVVQHCIAQLSLAQAKHTDIDTRHNALYTSLQLQQKQTQYNSKQNAIILQHHSCNTHETRTDQMCLRETTQQTT